MKKIDKKNLFQLAVLLLISGTMFSFVNYQDGPKPWVIPDEYKTMKNPEASDKESIAEGKKLYMSNCKACHGAEGVSDKLNLDLTDKKYKDNTDGELYYMSFIGRTKGHNLTKRIPYEEDRWYIINFLKTISKQ